MASDPPYKSVPARPWFYWSTLPRQGPWGWHTLGTAKWSTLPANIAWEAGGNGKDNVCFLAQIARHEDHPWLSLGPTEKMYDAIFCRPVPLPWQILRICIRRVCSWPRFGGRPLHSPCYCPHVILPMSDSWIGVLSRRYSSRTEEKQQ
jgi:hypothetical protein